MPECSCKKMLEVYKIMHEKEFDIVVNGKKAVKKSRFKRCSFRERMQVRVQHSKDEL